MKLTFGDGKILGIIAGTVAAAAVVTSIWLNPPSVNRARALDGKRLQDLQQIETAISMYHKSHQALPSNLKAIDNPWSADWHDPETMQPYEYAITGEMSYRLCAVFSRNYERSDGPVGSLSVGISFWKHKAGRDCIQEAVAHSGN
jgi:hypothetical protein